jgi:hypothetical protein
VREKGLNSVQQYDVDQQRKMAAAGRSFTTPAIITLVLWFVFWVPGLIANIVYLKEATNVEKLTGRTPEGKGCLVGMLWGFIGIPAILLVILVIASS